MRAYQLPKGGAGIDALVKIERPNPKPSYRQVLVKVSVFAQLSRPRHRARHLGCLHRAFQHQPEWLTQRLKTDFNASHNLKRLRSVASNIPDTPLGSAGITRSAAWPSAIPPP